MDDKQWKEMAKIVSFRFKTWPFVPLKQVAHTFRKNPTSISRITQKAYDHGVFEIVVHESPQPTLPTRVPSLEKKLKSHYELHHAIVVDVQTDKEKKEETRDDKLHVQLGLTFANFLEGCFWTGDHIGIGGGRGVAYTVDSFIAHETNTNIRVTSMTGSMSTRSWDATSGDEKSLDADQLAWRLSTKLRGAHARLNLPLALQSDKARKEQFSGDEPGSILNEEKWRNKPETYRPNVLLLGIGGLSGQHRLIDPDREVGSEATRKKIKELVSLSNEFKIRFGYCPVGDLGNRLFLVRSLPDVSKSSDQERLEQQIQAHIDTLNECFVVINCEQWKMVDKVLVVAGGNHKQHAIRTALSFKRSNRRPLITVFCTDSETARWLLNHP